MTIRIGAGARIYYPESMMYEVMMAAEPARPDEEIPVNPPAPKAEPGKIPGIDPRNEPELEPGKMIEDEKFTQKN